MNIIKYKENQPPLQIIGKLLSIMKIKPNKKI
jgi:hypothetical protein